MWKGGEALWRIIYALEDAKGFQMSLVHARQKIVLNMDNLLVNATAQTGNTEERLEKKNTTKRFI